MARVGRRLLRYACVCLLALAAYCGGGGGHSPVSAVCVHCAGNKLFQGEFIKVIYGSPSLYVTLQWTLLNSAIALAGTSVCVSASVPHAVLSPVCVCVTARLLRCGVHD